MASEQAEKAAMDIERLRAIKVWFERRFPSDPGAAYLQDAIVKLEDRPRLLRVEKEARAYVEWMEANGHGDYGALKAALSEEAKT